MRYGTGLALALTFGFAYGCGSSPEDECAKLVDAFARSWQRCGRSSYDAAKMNFDSFLQCGSVHDFKQDQVDQCVSALDAMDCNAVKSGSSPASCTGALSK